MNGSGAWQDLPGDILVRILTKLSEQQPAGQQQEEADPRDPFLGQRSAVRALLTVSAVTRSWGAAAQADGIWQALAMRTATFEVLELEAQMIVAPRPTMPGCWAVGQQVWVDTGVGPEHAVVLGPSASASAKGLRVRFDDGVVEDDWDKDNFCLISPCWWARGVRRVLASRLLSPSGHNPQAHHDAVFSEPRPEDYSLGIRVSRDGTELLSELADIHLPRASYNRTKSRPKQAKGGKRKAKHQEFEMAATTMDGRGVTSGRQYPLPGTSWILDSLEEAVAPDLELFVLRKADGARLTLCCFGAPHEAEEIHSSFDYESDYGKAPPHFWGWLDTRGCDGTLCLRLSFKIHIDMQPVEGEGYWAAHRASVTGVSVALNSNNLGDSRGTLATAEDFLEKVNAAAYRDFWICPPMTHSQLELTRVRSLHIRQSEHHRVELPHEEVWTPSRSDYLIGISVSAGGVHQCARLVELSLAPTFEWNGMGHAPPLLLAEWSHGAIMLTTAPDMMTVPFAPWRVPKASTTAAGFLAPTAEAQVAVVDVFLLRKSDGARLAMVSQEPASAPVYGRRPPSAGAALAAAKMFGAYSYCIDRMLLARQGATAHLPVLVDVKIESEMANGWKVPQDAGNHVSLNIQVALSGPVDDLFWRGCSSVEGMLSVLESPSFACRWV